MSITRHYLKKRHWLKRRPNKTVNDLKLLNVNNAEKNLHFFYIYIPFLLFFLLL